MDQKMTRILKLMKNKEQGKSRGMARDSKKETEVVVLVEDLYKNYQSIYEQYGNLRDEAERIVKSSKNNEDISSSSSTSSSSDSDSEYFSSEEITNSSIHHNLQNEQSSNWIQTVELEKQIVLKNEALAKVDSLHWELDSVRSQKRDSENRKNQEISENMNLIGKLKEELAEKNGVEQKMLEERERVLARLKDLEAEVDTVHYRKREIEEQNIRMRSENQWLNTKNSELEIALTSKETEASSQTIALMEQVKNLKQKLEALQAEKTKLEQEMEQYKHDFSHRISEIEAENNKLKNKIVDQERNLKEKEEKIATIREKHKQSKSCLPDVASGLTGVERKMEELAEDLRSGLEDKIRLLSQRILVAEQLIRTLGQFEKKMAKMENILKEKDEEVYRLAEEKREVIRQLCVVIDHHRSRYDHLKDTMLGKKLRNGRMI